MVTAYLGLGSNLGDRERNLAKALRRLGQRMTVEQVSSIYETEPMGYREQPWFLNAVCRLSTELDPFSLLRLVKEIEVELGRAPSFANAPRVIDIDILFYGDEVVAAESLTIPHPRLAQRLFVLVPLAEMFGYASELRNLTSGRGSFTMHFEHYEAVPYAIAEEVVASRKRAA